MLTVLVLTRLAACSTVLSATVKSKFLNFKNPPTLYTRGHYSFAEIYVFVVRIVYMNKFRRNLCLVSRFFFRDRHLSEELLYIF